MTGTDKIFTATKLKFENDVSLRFKEYISLTPGTKNKSRNKKEDCCESRRFSYSVHAISVTMLLFDQVTPIDVAN